MCQHSPTDGLVNHSKENRSAPYCRLERSPHSCERGASVSLVSPKQTLWLLFKEKRTVHEQPFVQCLLEQSTVIARAYESVQQFRQILGPARRGRFGAVCTRSRAKSDPRTHAVCPAAGLGSRRSMRSSLPAVRDRSKASKCGSVTGVCLHARGFRPVTPNLLSKSSRQTGRPPCWWARVIRCLA